MPDKKLWRVLLEECLNDKGGMSGSISRMELSHFSCPQNGVVFPGTALQRLRGSLRQYLSLIIWLQRSSLSTDMRLFFNQFYHTFICIFPIASCQKGLNFLHSLGLCITELLAEFDLIPLLDALGHLASKRKSHRALFMSAGEQCNVQARTFLQLLGKDATI